MFEELADQRTGLVLVVWPQGVHLLRLAAPGMAVGKPIDAALGQEIERFQVARHGLLRVGAVVPSRSASRRPWAPVRTAAGRGSPRPWPPWRRTPIAEAGPACSASCGLAPVDPEIHRLADHLLARSDLQARGVAQHHLLPSRGGGVEGNLHPGEQAAFRRAAEERTARLLAGLAPKFRVAIGDDPQAVGGKRRPAEDHVLQAAIAGAGERHPLLGEMVITVERPRDLDMHRLPLIARGECVAGQVHRHRLELGKSHRALAVSIANSSPLTL